jgi:hypothetical protein
MSKHHPHTGRARKVREHIAAHPEGATARSIIAAVEPGCSYPKMLGTIGTIEAHGGIRREVRDGQIHFLPTATTLIDARTLRRGSQRTPATREALPKRAAPLAQPGTTTRAHTGEPLRRAFPCTTNNLSSPIESKRPTRDQLAADVAEFEARGGRIQVLARGDTAESLRNATQPSCRKRQA